MKYIKLEKISNVVKNAVSRFLPAILCLVVAVILNGIDIESRQDNNLIYVYTMVIGAGIYVLVQILAERYIIKTKEKLALLVGGSVLIILFYILLYHGRSYNTIIDIRTSVTLFSLFIAFTWIPSIGKKDKFNKSFMVHFKGFFIALFYSVILYIGVSLIIVAINELLFSISYRIYGHSANLIFILFAPIYFLSLIPIYPGRKENAVVTDEVTIERMSSCPKYLDILISYIIIPITMAFTMILFLYFVRSIGGKFWTDNLLEPMIVSYSITVILVYLLSSNLSNKIVLLFRKIFPKILIPIVLLQTIASIIKIEEMGLTHGRYYVILYGIFATISGIIFSFLSVKKNGMIAILLIIFSVISIVPPIDAFTISYTSQKNKLEDVLNRNHMIQDDKIVYNPELSKEDKDIMISSFRYLQNMGYTKDIYWLSQGQEEYLSFEKIFGFNQYEENEESYKYIFVFLDKDTVIPIQGFDYFSSLNIYSNKDNEIKLGEFQHEGVQYQILQDFSEDAPRILIQDQEENEVISFLCSQVYHRYQAYVNAKSELDLNDATFTIENEDSKMEMIIYEATIDVGHSENNYNMLISMLVKMK